MDAMIVFMGFVLLLSVLIVIVANSTNQQSQQLQAIYRRLRTLDGPAHVVAGAEEMRRDRAVHLDKLVMMEVELNQQNRNELTEDEKKKAEGKNWKTDSSGGQIRVFMKNHGCHPFGNAKARAVVWNFPDPIPQHREPLYGNRPDLMAKYPTHDDKKAFWRLPTLYKTVQDKNLADKLHEKFPLVMTSGRLVEYEGGGEETRANPWLAELQQEMFVEINPETASKRGIRNGERVWVSTPTGARINVQALVTPRVDKETVFLPFHFSGRWQGADMLAHYPAGAAPIVRGEAINTATTLALMEAAGRAGVTVQSLSVKSTTLDDVFVHYTGRALRDSLQEAAVTDSPFMMRRG